MTTTLDPSTPTDLGVRHTRMDSRLGELTLVADADGLTGVYFPGHWTRPDRAGFGPEVGPGDGFVAAIGQLEEYLRGRRRRFSLDLHLIGTEAERRTWRLLGEIGYGQTRSYGELAGELGLTAREVGGLVGRNPLSIIVPCHRVVGVTGKLTGYAGGLARKRSLLELEGALHPPEPGLW